VPLASASKHPVRKPEGDNGSEHEKWFERSKDLYVLWTGFRDEQPVMSAFYVDDSLTDNPHPTLTIGLPSIRRPYTKTWKREIRRRKRKGRNWKNSNPQKAQEQLEQELKEITEQYQKQQKQRKEAADKATEGL